MSEFEDSLAVAQSMIGHKILAVELIEDENPDKAWLEHEVCYLTLDDGRKIRFGSWSYDGSGVTIYEDET